MAVLVLLLCSAVLAPYTGFAQGCEDGFLCTIGDVCVDETCMGERLECPDDGNACTRERCRESSGQCESDSRVCSGSCLTGECDPGTGCVPLPDGTGCDDRNACTSDDRCLLGVCHGTAVEDGMPCSDVLGPCTVDDRCVRGSCIGQLRQCPNNDGDLCTPELCDFLTGQCITLPRTTCDRPCQSGICAAETGLCPSVEDGAACDDQNECTTRDRCEQGQCIGSAGGLEETATPTPSNPPSPTPSATAPSASASPTPSPRSEPTPIPPTRTEPPTATSTSPPPTHTSEPEPSPSPTAPIPSLEAAGSGCNVLAQAPEVAAWTALLFCGLPFALAKRFSRRHHTPPP